MNFVHNIYLYYICAYELIGKHSKFRSSSVVDVVVGQVQAKREKEQRQRANRNQDFPDTLQIQRKIRVCVCRFINIAQKQEAQTFCQQNVHSLIMIIFYIVKSAYSIIYINN